MFSARRYFSFLIAFKSQSIKSYSKKVLSIQSVDAYQIQLYRLPRRVRSRYFVADLKRYHMDMRSASLFLRPAESDLQSA
jgi:hypothetical protein